MSRFLSLGTLLLTITTATSPTPPVPDPPGDVTALVEDINLVVESLDRTEDEVRQGTRVRLTLVSDVLFDLDKANVKPAARQRLARLAEEIRPVGPVTIDGHTDDQGTDAYNVTLSNRRAAAVREVLAPLLGDRNATFRIRGLGEQRPRLPNIVQGRPSEENRARNRRVEISFNTRTG